MKYFYNIRAFILSLFINSPISRKYDCNFYLNGKKISAYNIVKNNHKKHVGVICKNSIDFLDYFNKSNINVNLINTKRVDYNNSIYYRILNYTDLCSLTF